jgi:hypothetical protein
MPTTLVDRVAAVLRSEFAKKEVRSFEWIANAIVAEVMQGGAWLAPAELSDEVVDKALLMNGHTRPADREKSRDNLRARWQRIRSAIIL